MTIQARYLIAVNGIHYAVYGRGASEPERLAAARAEAGRLARGGKRAKLQSVAARMLAESKELESDVAEALGRDFMRLYANPDILPGRWGGLLRSLAAR